MPTLTTPARADLRVLPHVLGESDPGLDGPHLLRIQPMPTTTALVFAGGWTSVSRVWRPGDAGRCTLCPGRTCGAVEVAADGTASCLVAVPGPVADADADLLVLPRPSTAPAAAPAGPRLAPGTSQGGRR